MGVDTKGAESPFVSILDARREPDRERGCPDFYQDLNIDQIIDRICRLWGENVSSFYGYFPADEACEDYRREVLGDVKLTGVYEALRDFTEKMDARREVFVKKEDVSHRLQKAAWHIREIHDYCRAFTELHEALRTVPFRSEGMQSFLGYLEGYLGGEGFRAMQSEATGLLAEMDTFRLVLTYENDRFYVAEGEVLGTYDAFLESCFPGQGKRMESPFETVPELVDLERELLKVFQKKSPDFFARAEAFSQKHEIYAEDVLLRFASEIRYYLSYYCFEKKMEEMGFRFCVPAKISGRTLAGTHGQEFGRSGGKYAAGSEDCDRETDETAKQGETADDSEKREREMVHPMEQGEAADDSEKQGIETNHPMKQGEAASQTEKGGVETDSSGDRMYARGLYDLALACANAGRAEDIVSNDMEYRVGESFFVVTGPNQGGKTTFARSLGQMVYLAKMGLDVPAESAALYHFPNLLTHFSVEESTQTGRGKLMDELVRLVPIMKAPCERNFVVINELFTTAANYDACIMGKRVLEHLLAQGCMGIYVTHLAELGEERPGVASLRAMLDGRGERSFKIERDRAADHASAESQVKEYGLTYAQLKERLK